MKKMTVNGKQYSAVFLMICGLSLYFLHTMSSGANIGLPLFMEKYAEYPTTTITWVVTITMFAAIPTQIFNGVILKKLGFKVTTIVSAAVSIIAGVLPFFVDLSLGALIACRAIVGLAYGVAMPIAYSYISALFDGDARSSLLGVGQSISALSGVIITSVAGILAAISMGHLFLYHLVVLIPLLLGFVMPSPAIEEKTEEVTESAKADFNIGKSAWVLCILYGLAMLGWYPFPLYSSAIIVGEGIGTTVDAGFVGTVGTIGCLVGGAAYPLVNKIFKNKTVGIAFCLMAIGYAVTQFGSSLILMYVGYTVAGFGYFTFVPACMDYLGFAVTGAKYATATGISFALACAVGQVASYLLNFVGGIFGRVDDFRFYYLVTCIFLAVLAIIFIVRPVKSADASKAETAE